jgi:phage terminase large subunit-like protein
MSLLNADRPVSTQPTHLWVPPGALPNDQADEAIDLASIAGLDLDDWQADVVRESMTVSGTGKWAAREVGVIVTRQSGKGSILEVRQLAGLFVTKERLQIHSAHEFKTCYEHFRRVKDLVEGCDYLAKQVKIIRTGAGDQAIELINGCRIRFIARSRSSGRGFSADTVYLDEAFELSDATMGALIPALSARPNSQVWYTSSAPHADSTVLHRVLSRGRAGGDPRLVYFEWSNDADADLDDRANWYRANPALGMRVSEDDVASERNALSDAEFARERLGIPDVLAGSEGAVIPLDLWDSLKAEKSDIVSGESFALDVSPRSQVVWSSFAVAGHCADGVVQVEVFDRRTGTDHIVERAVELHRKHDKPIRIEKGGPAGSFVSLLAQAGVPVEEVTTADLARATGQFIDAANSGRLRHLGDAALRSSVAGAVLRHTGDADLWGRRSAKVDVSALVASTLAVGGVRSDDVEPLIRF